MGIFGRRPYGSNYRRLHRPKYSASIALKPQTAKPPVMDTPTALPRTHICRGWERTAYGCQTGAQVNGPSPTTVAYVRAQSCRNHQQAKHIAGLAIFPSHSSHKPHAELNVLVSAPFQASSFHSDQPSPSFGWGFCLSIARERGLNFERTARSYSARPCKLDLRNGPS